MEPRDQLRLLTDGVGCSVCDTVVPPDRIRLLAHRDDLAFVEIDCADCRSTTLGFVVAGALPPEAVRFADAPPIGADDVLEVHELLESWQGDLRGLLEGRRRAWPDGQGALP
jgi:hypothetical protein